MNSFAQGVCESTTGLKENYNRSEEEIKAAPEREQVDPLESNFTT